MKRRRRRGSKCRLCGRDEGYHCRFLKYEYGDNKMCWQSEYVTDVMKENRILFESLLERGVKRVVNHSKIHKKKKKVNDC